MCINLKDTKKNPDSAVSMCWGNFNNESKLHYLVKDSNL